MKLSVLPRLGLIDRFHFRRPISNGWRPLSLNQKTFHFINVITVSLMGIIAALSWISHKYGGIIFTDPQRGFSTPQTFVYKYLPVLVTVLYALFWGWIDLDIKRMEPYYQLASRSGTSARNSLALNYPSMFFPLVPWHSAKSGHWAVFAISMISIITNWVFIPLQNGIYTTKTIEYNYKLQATQQHGLASLGDQSSRLSRVFLRDASFVLWLGQRLPSFTTAEFALAPVNIISGITGLNDTFNTITTLYEMDLDCEVPTPVVGHDTYFSFDDGKGCNTGSIISWNSSWIEPYHADFMSKFEAYHISRYRDSENVIDKPMLQSSMLKSKCPDDSKVFLAWRGTSYSTTKFDNVNATALICRRTYFSQKVKATISLPARTIKKVERIDDRQPLTHELFNHTIFEEIVDTADRVVSSGIIKMTDEAVFAKQAFVTNMSLILPVHTMTVLAIGSTKWQPAEYVKPMQLTKAFKSAYRLAFALAIHSVMEPPSPITSHSTPNSTLNSMTQELEGSASFQVVTVVPTFAILVELTLATVLCFSVFLLWNVPERRSILTRDPNCIAETIKISRDPTLRHIVDSMFGDENAAVCHSDNLNCRLRSNGAFEPPKIRVKMGHDKHSKEDTNIEEALLTSGETQHIGLPFVEPAEYRWYTGFGLILALSVMLISLAVLHSRCYSNEGMNLPSSNEIVVQIITNVIPTMVVSSIEPIWVWLTRMASLLAPLENILHVSGSAERSILLTYAATPPQLVLLKAFKRKNIVLGLVSIVACTAGILTVAVSGLFMISHSMKAVIVDLPALYSGPVISLNGTLDYNDGLREFEIALSNITNQTALPSWLVPHQFFVPPDLSVLHGPDFEHLKMQATGYSINSQCTELTASPTAKDNYEYGIYNCGNRLVLETKHLVENGHRFSCMIPGFSDKIYSPDGVFNPSGSGIVLNTSPGTKLIRLGATLVSANNTKNISDHIDGYKTTADSTTCQEMLIFGSIQANLPVYASDLGCTSPDALVSYNANASLMICKPVITYETFEISVSPTGLLLSANPLNKVPVKMSSLIDFKPILDTVLGSFRPASHGLGFLRWQNGSDINTMMDYLQYYKTNSSIFLDPTKSLPPISQQIALTEDLLTRLFVIGLRMALNRLTPATETTPKVSVEMMTLKRQIYLSPTAFAVSIAVLSIQLLVASLFFSTRPRPFLRRLPTSLAAQISLFANSHMVDDVLKTAYGNFEELDRRGWRYAYGKFVGMNGKPNEGIERMPFVFNLGQRPSSFQRTWARLSLWRHVQDEKMRSTLTPESCEQESFRTPKSGSLGSDLPWPLPTSPLPQYSPVSAGLSIPPSYRSRSVSQVSSRSINSASVSPHSPTPSTTLLSSEEA